MQDEKAHKALEELCSDYWYPVYGFLRHNGATHDDGLDWTQGFFLSLIEREALEHADPGRGKFRTYLLACLKNYVSGERARETAVKRGGGNVVSLDAEGARTRCLLENVLTRLGKEWDRVGKADLFARMCWEGGSKRPRVLLIGLPAATVYFYSRVYFYPAL